MADYNIQWQHKVSPQDTSSGKSKGVSPFFRKEQEVILIAPEMESMKVETTEEEVLKEDLKKLRVRYKYLQGEIRKLSKSVGAHKTIDISKASNIDFWLSEEDDIWDKL